ncbi:initiation-specific alpha-1,6-mannosyltransferase SCDLUD_001544 [Saccharomycodes ludwigii]|uniref:initiation-specific alpha-1,6-mannosyltransferase n=1 Tax=Saccharomycodes ludwigii TaxID=36035 RepID=UPI001E85D75A|nr:hypothetical protein SCDLUD_001544 [Saccharomycodes ludwigii]KAH3901766.1 hypothetical protein SCDLUD_001544 [Saccharomycodes ludwigii]
MHYYASKKRSIISIIISLILYVVIFKTLANLPEINDKNNSNEIILPSTYNPPLNLKKLDSSHSSLDMNNLRSQLVANFPYNPRVPIPKHIWQTWKVGLSSPEFPNHMRGYVSKWEEKVIPKDSKTGEFTTIEKDFAEPSEIDKQWVHSLLSDGEIDILLEQLFGSTAPAIIKAYKLMPTNILKADFFRYLILYARGGIYSDVDTIPLKNLEDWPGNNLQFLEKFNVLDNKEDQNIDGGNKNVNANTIRYKNKKETQSSGNSDGKLITPGLVIGIEADPDREDWNEFYARRIQFCQWTIQAKPGHPALRELILNITATTINSVENSIDFKNEYSFKGENMQDFKINRRGRKERDLENLNDDFKNSGDDVDGTDIMNWTGPGVFSDAIFQYLNNLLEYNSNIEIYNTNLQPTTTAAAEHDDDEDKILKTTRKFYKEISNGLMGENRFHWGFFSLLKNPILIDDILILPITSFSPGVGHMGSKGPQDKIAFVTHLFGGTWKND